MRRAVFLAIPIAIAACDSGDEVTPPDAVAAADSDAIEESAPRDSGDSAIAIEDGLDSDATDSAFEAESDSTLDDSASDAGIDTAIDSAPSDDGEADTSVDATVADVADASPDTSDATTDSGIIDAGDSGVVSARWRPTGGPWATGRLARVAIDGSEWIITTENSWIFRSRDGGATFEPWADGMARRRDAWLGGAAISGGKALFSGAPGVLSAPLAGGAFDELLSTSSSAAGYGPIISTASGAWVTTQSSSSSMRRSIDGGATWSSAYWYGPSQFLRTVDDTILGTNGSAHLCQSIDAGATFTCFGTTGSTGETVYDAALVGGRYIALRNVSLITRTTTETSWTTIPTTSRMHALAVDGSNVVALGPVGSMRSTDGGATWTALPTTRLTTSSSPVVVGGAFVAATSFDGLQRSTDGGVTWSSFGRGVQATPMQRLWVRPPAIAGGPSTLWGLARSGELMQSINGGTDWTVVRRDVQSFAFTGSTLIATGTYDVARSTDDGATFTVVAPTSYSYNSATVAVGSNVLILGTGLLRSTDSGLTWTTLYPTNAPARLAVDPTRSRVLGPGADGIMRSDDGGLTWTRSTTTLTGGVDVVVAADGTAYASTYDGAVHKSTDGGITWTVVIASSSAPTPPGFFLDSRIGVGARGELLVPKLESVGSAGETRFVLNRVEPDGTLVRIDNGLYANDVRDYAVDGTALLAATNAGVYRLDP